MKAPRRPVVLLVAEAVTLAHFARIVALAKALDPADYDVVVATDARYSSLDPLPGFAFRPIWSVPTADFANALAQGKPLYDAGTLRRYVDNDIELINDVKPDLIVGDFRLSLAVSAPLAGIPYAAVVNAYWSPYADIDYPVPDLPMTRLLGVPVAQALFNAARPIAFALHAGPLNQVRRHFGLPNLGHDVRVAYSWGDYTLYADVPEMVRMRPLPPNHRYLGPPRWSARMSLPAWWSNLPTDRPLVLLTLGTSGRADLLPQILFELAKLPITLVAVTAGGVAPPIASNNVFVAEYLPLDAAMQHCALVICNGGSLTTYQALESGSPVLGICTNMDQLLNMNCIERLGAGLHLRADGLKAAELRTAVLHLLDDPTYSQAARLSGERFRQMNAGQRFREFVAEIVDQPTLGTGR